MRHMIACGISAICILLLSIAPAYAQLQTGTITGAVQDGTGAVIPGVEVSLSSVGVIGGTQQTLTDERGMYRFNNLIPGTYAVKVEMPGFKTVMNESIVINADITVRVNVTLEVGQISDTVTVQGEAPLLDTTTALNQAVLDRQFRDTIPTGGDLWTIGRLVPGVQAGNYDIGGTSSFQQTGLTSHGGGDQKFAVDGLNLSWAGGSGDSTAIYYDVAMFEEVNYQVGNIGAENKEGGVIMNMVTRTGTNDFKGDFFFWGTTQSLQSNNLSDKMKTDLLSTVPARARAANPNLIPQNRILGMFDSGLSLSGPVVRDKLWWTVSGKLNSLNQYQIGAYNVDGTQGVDDNRIINYSAKVSWQANSANQLHYSFNRNLKNRYHRRSGFTENRAAVLQDQKGYSSQLKWTSTLSSRAVLDVSLGYSFIDFPSRHQNEVQPGDIPRFDRTTEVTTVAAGTYNTRPADRRAASASLSYFLGAHDLKIGYQFDESMEHDRVYSMSHFPNGLRAVYANGVPDEVTLYNSPVDSRQYVRYHSAFIQDKWSPTRRLTLNLGLRGETVQGWVPENCYPGIPIFPWNIPAQCFTKVVVPTWFDFSPRTGIVFDLFGDGKSAIKASANVYHDGVGSSHPATIDPANSSTRVMDWVDRNNDLIPQFNELDGTLTEPFSFGSNNSFVDGLKRPLNIEYAAEFQQELPHEIVISASYHHRDNWRGISSYNAARPRGLEAFNAIPFTLPSNDPNMIESARGQQITIYNVKAPYQTVADRLVFYNSSHRDNFFNGVDFSATKRMTSGWMMLMGLSFARDYNRAGIDRDAPNTRFNGGPVTSNVPVTFKISGSYELPFGISASGSFQHYTGKPENQTFRINRADITSERLSTSTLDIALAQVGEFQRPDVNMLDLSFKKEIRFGDSYRFALHTDMFNLNNSNAIQGRETRLGTTYGRVNSVLAPRLIRFGMKAYF